MYRSSLGQSYNGGRGSPYAPRLGHQDRSFSDLFEYVDANDAAARRPEDYLSAIPVEDDDAPDVLHVKYMGQQFKLEFPAYSISESGVTVQDVRRRVAEGLQQDPRRIRIVYKDKELKYDPYPIKRYGCKQNSELGVVVTEQLNDYGGTDNHQSSGDDSGSGSSLRPPENRRPRGLSTVRYRSDEFKEPSSSSTTTYLHPNGYSNRDSRDDRRRSQSHGRRRDPYSSSERIQEPARATPSPAAAAPTPRAPPADPNSPMGKVQALQVQFYDKWLPECQQFLRSPPSDQTQRDKEYRRLSESVMKHIIEGADAIELQGDTDARAERKRVLGDAQELLKKMDALAKSK